MKTAKLIVPVMLALFLSVSCSGKKKQDVKKVPELTSQDIIKRGEYLVTIIGCHDCHSPKNITPEGAALIQDRLLSGYQTSQPAANPDGTCIKDGWVLITMDLTATAGPWGVSYSANLTSDQTGIGNWTLENFATALKKGKYKGLEGSRTLLPPMPWQNFANIEDGDLEAIFAYLKSTKPITNVVPQPMTSMALGLSQ